MNSKILFGAAIAVLIVAAASFSPALAADALSAGSNPIPTFCDSSADHGTSASCKQEAEVTGATCPAGTHKANINCSLGNACSENGNPGTYCSCSYDCLPNSPPRGT